MLLARIQRAAKCGDETREEVCDVVRVEHRGGDEVPGVTNATLLAKLGADPSALAYCPASHFGCDR